MLMHFAQDWVCITVQSEGAGSLSCCRLTTMHSADFARLPAMEGKISSLYKPKICQVPTVGQWLSACETCVQVARTWKILKTFGNLSLAHLPWHYQEVIQCPLLLPVTPNSLELVQLSGQNVMYFLWFFRLLRLANSVFLCKKEREEPWSASASLSPSGMCWFVLE